MVMVGTNVEAEVVVNRRYNPVSAVWVGSEVY